jgi:hypothetical protein
MRNSPAAQIPADHTSKREAMQKKVIDCPISNHEPRRQSDNEQSGNAGPVSFLPVSVTLKKNVIVITIQGHFSKEALVQLKIRTVGESERDKEEGEWRKAETSV